MKLINHYQYFCLPSTLPLKKCQNHEYMALKYQAYSKALKWKIEVEASIYNILFQNVLVPKPES